MTETNTCKTIKRDSDGVTFVLVAIGKKSWSVIKTCANGEKHIRTGHPTHIQRIWEDLGRAKALWLKCHTTQ